MDSEKMVRVARKHAREVEEQARYIERLYRIAGGSKRMFRQTQLEILGERSGDELLGFVKYLAERELQKARKELSEMTKGATDEGQ